MFLQPVTEEEIMQLVENAKNKKSKDHDQVDMTLCLVKKIIPHIVKSLAHICNTCMYLTNERYFFRPDENRESYRYLKMGISRNSQIIDLYPYYPSYPKY